MLLCTKVSRMFISISKTRAITIILAKSLAKLFLNNLDKMNMSDYNRESHTRDAPPFPLFCEFLCQGYASLYGWPHSGLIHDMLKPYCLNKFGHLLYIALIDTRRSRSIYGKFSMGVFVENNLRLLNACSHFFIHTISYLSLETP